MQQADENVTDDLNLVPTKPEDSFFHGGHWGQCLELVTHLCQYGESILLVTGIEGIGKSTLKQALIHNSDNRFSFCEITANANLTIDAIKHKINSEFDATELNSVVVTEQNNLLVLLIDDAEKLDLNVISAILQLKNNITIARRLQIVLFADSQLEAKIQRSPLKDKFAELVHTIELEKLTLTEVDAFLHYLWRKQRNDAELDIDKATLKKIYISSNGIPAKVQQISISILNGKDVNKINLGSKRLSPFSVGLTVTFGLLFCVLAFLWPSSEREEVAQMQTQVIPDISAELQSDAPPPETQQAETQQTITLTDMPDTVGQIPTPEGMIASDFVETPKDSVAINAPEPASDSADTVNNSVVTESVAKTDYTEQIARLEGKLAALQQRVEQEQDARQLAERKVQEILRNKPQNAIEKHKSATKPKNASKIKNTSKLNKTDEFLLDLPSKNYTLQLVAASNETKVKDFISRNNLSSKARYFRSTYKGKPWFIVIYGNYENRSAALTALQQLPHNVKQAQPWPREISSIQNTIKKR